MPVCVSSVQFPPPTGPSVPPHIPIALCDVLRATDSPSRTFPHFDSPSVTQIPPMRLPQCPAPHIWNDSECTWK
eukprot:2711218-Rhodomonas_salina.2